MFLCDNWNDLKCNESHFPHFIKCDNIVVIDMIVCRIHFILLYGVLNFF